MNLGLKNSTRFMLWKRQHSFLIVKIMNPIRILPITSKNYDGIFRYRRIFVLSLAGSLPKNNLACFVSFGVPFADEVLDGLWVGPRHLQLRLQQHILLGQDAVGVVQELYPILLSRPGCLSLFQLLFGPSSVRTTLLQEIGKSTFSPCKRKMGQRRRTPISLWAI